MREYAATARGATMLDLPLEKLADAVAALRNEVWNRPEHERRALPRIRVWAPRPIHLAGAGPAAASHDANPPLEVWLVDLACGGVGLISPRPLDVGLEFFVTLPMMEAAPVTLLCRVLHCQPAANGSFTVGARFVREVDAQQPADHRSSAPLRQAS